MADRGKIGAWGHISLQITGRGTLPLKSPSRALYSTGGQKALSSLWPFYCVPFRESVLLSPLSLWRGVWRAVWRLPPAPSGQCYSYLYCLLVYFGGGAESVFVCSADTELEYGTERERERAGAYQYFGQQIPILVRFFPPVTSAMAYMLGDKAH